MKKIAAILVKGVFICLILFLGFCIAYYFKSRLPFEFSRQYSLHQYFPFKYLAREEVIEPDGPGTVMEEDFNAWQSFSRWYHIWMAEKGTVELGAGENGYRNSESLFVANKGGSVWSISPAVYIRVVPGDLYSFQAMLRTNLPGQAAGLRVVFYDGYKDKVEKRGESSDITGTEDTWKRARFEFSIPRGVGYIVPRVRGTGRGVTRIDDIVIKKKKRG